MARKSTPPAGEIEPLIEDAEVIDDEDEQPAAEPLITGTFALYETNGSYIAAVWSEQTGDVIRAVPKRLLAMLMKSPQVQRMIGL